MGRESACRAVRVNGGYVLSDIIRIYGGTVKSGTAASGFVVRKLNENGIILFSIGIAANIVGSESAGMPIAAEGQVHITTYGNGEYSLWTDSIPTITQPHTNLSCSITITS